MNRQTKKIWLTVFFLLGLLLSLAAASFLVRQKQIIKKKAVGENARLELPSVLSVNTGEEFTLPLMVATDQIPIVVVDAVLDFDKSKLQLMDIIPYPENSTLKTFVPVDENGIFKKQEVIQKANQTGELVFGAVAFDWSGNSITSGFNGTLGPANPLAALRFQALNPGLTAINFIFSIGGTTDSNLVRESDAVDILAKTTNLSLTINPVVTPTPTPTLVLTPTPTQTPTLSPTPTLTPTPVSASLSFSVKFQGISTAGLTKNVRIILKQGTAEKYRLDSISLSSVANGVFSGRIDNISPGTYDIFIKGRTHLQKKFANITLNPGENTQNWLNEADILKAGDFNNDNKLRIDDISQMLTVYTSLSVPVNETNRIYDIDSNNVINITDIATVLGNYTALTVPGDE